MPGTGGRVDVEDSKCVHETNRLDVPSDFFVKHQKADTSSPSMWTTLNRPETDRLDVPDLDEDKRPA